MQGAAGPPAHSPHPGGCDGKRPRCPTALPCVEASHKRQERWSTFLELAALGLARLTALQKLGTRGIATGDALWRLVARSLARRYAQRFDKATCPFQFALQAHTCTDCLASMTRVADPEATVVSLDEGSTVATCLLLSKGGSGQACGRVSARRQPQQTSGCVGQKPAQAATAGSALVVGARDPAGRRRMRVRASPRLLGEIRQAAQAWKPLPRPTARTSALRSLANCTIGCNPARALQAWGQKELLPCALPRAARGWGSLRESKARRANDHARQVPACMKCGTLSSVGTGVDKAATRSTESSQAQATRGIRAATVAALRSNFSEALSLLDAASGSKIGAPVSPSEPDVTPLLSPCWRPTSASAAAPGAGVGSRGTLSTTSVPRGGERRPERWSGRATACCCCAASNAAASASGASSRAARTAAGRVGGAEASA